MAKKKVALVFEVDSPVNIENRNKNPQRGAAFDIEHYTHGTLR